MITPRSLWLTPLSALAFSLLLTGIAAGFARSAERTRDEMRFVTLVQETDDAIATRLNIYLSLLRGVAGLFAAKGNAVSLAEFRAYVNPLDMKQDYPGIQGIGFSRRVASGEIPALEASLRKQGMTNFQVWPPVPDSRERHSIVYLEPLDIRNRSALGFDMYTEPQRRAAMGRARDTAEAAATGPVTLVQEIDTDRQTGFLIYEPVYRHPDPPTGVAQRRTELIGFAYAPFRARDLLGGDSGKGQGQQRLRMQVFDAASLTASGQLFDSHPGLSSRYRPRLSRDTQISLGGRTWIVRHSTTPEFESTLMHPSPVVLVAGLIASAAVFGVTRLLVAGLIRATADANALARSREALQQSEAQQRVFLRDVLSSVTEGRLRLVEKPEDLPALLYGKPGAVEEVSLSLDSTTALGDLRRAVRCAAEAGGLSDVRMYDLLSAVGEASMNALQHGGGGYARVAARSVGSPNGLVQVWVEDQGRGIEMSTLPRATLERGYSSAGTLGHGFWLMLKTADRVYLMTGPTGTTVVLEQDTTVPAPFWLTETWCDTGNIGTAVNKEPARH